MIETFFAADQLHSFGALLSALLIGAAFGWCLEQAGFGSSKRLAGIFYFRDMAVLKVMFSAVITAMLGLLLLFRLGYLESSSVYMPETFLGAQIIGGLLFGIGFVAGGWCPGTAAVGAASGKIDALVFLVGAITGSFIFNEAFVRIEPWYNKGAAGLRFIHEDLGLAAGEFALLLTFLAVIAFWIAELIEDKFQFTVTAARSRSLWIFSFSILLVAVGVAAMPAKTRMISGGADRQALMKGVFSGEGLFPAVELARELAMGNKKIICVDLRSKEEYDEWHIPGARHFTPETLLEGLERYRKYDRMVLYAHDMMLAAQVLMLIKMNGFDNAVILQGGLEGLFETVLKPAALRQDSLTPQQKQEIESWRGFFLGSSGAVGSKMPVGLGSGQE